MTDQMIILGLKDDSKDAFDYLIEKYSPIILKIIKSILNKSHEEDYIIECFDDTILKVWQKVDKHDEKLEFKYWIATIAKNTALDYKRKLNKIYKTEAIEDQHIKGRSAEEEYILLDDIKTLNKFVNNLKEGEKKLFIQKFILGYSTEELCNEYVISSSALYKRISRLKEKIKVELADTDKKEKGVIYYGK